MGMIWLSSAADRTSRPAHTPLIDNRVPPVLSPRGLTSGSLILEVSMGPTFSARQPLLRYRHPRAGCHFAVWMDEYGAARVELRSGAARFRLSVGAEQAALPQQLRLTFSWQAPGGQGVNTALLSVENLGRGTLHQAESDTALPLPVPVVDALLAENTIHHIAPVVSLVALSDQIEPVGFIPSIAAGAPVETVNGPVPIEQLKPGDRVLTVDHGPQPLRWVCARTVPMMGLFRPLRLRAPYFGLSRDILVAPEQRILFENDAVEYLCGQDSMLAEVRDIENNISVLQEPATAAGIRLYQLLFDQHEIITVAGCRLESLFIGDIADHPGLRHSTLLSVLPQENIPRHTHLARPLLRSYEARAVQMEMLH
ncbi:MAG: hypothetical protein CSA68_03470 [Rhodobacterales bacterium]|nr:MAG: hypothetical protein CSA68_03470 [Rhodobacterales bacterium]